MWNPIKTAPKDRAILLWFPDGPFACPAEWACIGKDDRDFWAWVIADELSEHEDGIVWAESAQPTLWTELPPDLPIP